MKRQEDVIKEAGMELVKALGLTADKEVLDREYMCLERFTPGFQPNDPDYPSEGPVPFFSESFLYPLLGKDEARTVLNLLCRVMTAAGIPRNEQDRLACLADQTMECEFCWDGYRGEDICNVCKGKCYRKPGLGKDDEE